MSDERTGSCGCGAVRFLIEGPIKSVANCHCSKCRKFNGSAFSTYAAVPRPALKFIVGEAGLSAHTLVSGFVRHFCRHCGSPVFNLNPDFPNHYMVNLGAFDRPADLLPAINVYCSSMLPWVSKVGDLPSFQEAYQKPAG
jgi:hypothetical protein